MSWRDRGHDDGDDPTPFGGGQDRAGGDWRGVRPTFDDPLSWSVSLGRYAGITVRVHLFFLIFIAAQLLRAAFAAPPSSGGTSLGMGPMLVLLLCLWWSVLLHEVGHCFAARAGGGEADEILMWPLGGLANCRPVATPIAHLATAAGGPLVNLAILAVLVPTLGLWSGAWAGVAIPNPLHLGGLDQVDHSWTLTTHFLLVWCNLVLLLFNLLPAFPFDGGRILQALLWNRVGYAPSMRTAVRIGYVAAIVLGIAGFALQELMLVAVAIFSGISCWLMMRRLDFTQETLGFEPAGEDDVVGRPDPEVDAEARRRVAEEARREAEAAQLDRILQKINDSGLRSLSARERKILHEATERRRRGQH